MGSDRRPISMEELAKHATEEDCWIMLHDLVLNLPKSFLDEHPGGPEVVSALGGRDTTQEFEDIAHSDTARNWGNDFIIGYREGSDEETQTKKIPKTSELKNGRGESGNTFMIGAVIMVILAVLAYFFLRQM